MSEVETLEQKPIVDIMKSAAHRLRSAQPELESATFDAECLMADLLGKTRAWLRAFPETILSAEQSRAFEVMLQRRCEGEPLAYIRGTQEFWSLPFSVGPEVLIPRSDTETLVEAALERVETPAARVLDLGTGSGAIAVALSVERPEWQILAVDKHPESLETAISNARRLGLSKLEFVRSDWYSEIETGSCFDLIVSNPPYIPAEDSHLRALRFEPQRALIGGEDGLDDIRKIISDAPDRLADGGALVLEHGWDQVESVTSLLREAGFMSIESRRDLAGNWRVTSGLWPGRNG